MPKVKEAEEQAAKQNRWGSLAARLEGMCEEVLSLNEADEAGGLDGSSEDHHHASNGIVPAVAVTGAGIGIGGAAAMMHGTNSGRMGGVGGPYQQLMQFPLSPPGPVQTTSTTLKDWIVTKKIDREIREATSELPAAPASGGGAMGPYEKQHVERCVKIAHLVVSSLAKSFEGGKDSNGSNKNSDGNGRGNSDSFDGSEDWEPRPQDVDDECIMVTENAATGEILDASFDIYRNFNWGDDDEDANNEEDDPSSRKRKLGLIFEALGRLLYRLFMEGEDVPPCASALLLLDKDHAQVGDKGADRQDGEKGADRQDGEKAVVILDEDDILEMLRSLPKPVGNGKDDRIVAAMRQGGLPMSLCRLVTDLLNTADFIKSGGGNSSSHNSNNDNNNSVHSNPGGDDELGTSSRFASLSDVRSDIRQMIDFPDAFLYDTINSRWELVFGNNHMFGRKNELRRLTDAAERIRLGSGKKEVVMVDGHAGSGKSRLVREVRRPLQDGGWVFLRCKFGRAAQAQGGGEPLSVIALGLDEFFSSGVACCSSPTLDPLAPQMGPNGNGCPSLGGCSCSNAGCPRRVCRRLESLVGLEGLRILSEQMPSLRSLVGGSGRVDLTNGGGVGTQGKFLTNHLFRTLLYTLASFSPVLFFVDDLQWADVASLELLTSLMNRVVTNNFDDDYNTNRILFVGAHRTDGIMEEPTLNSMVRQFEASDTINVTRISLHGFQLESLNEMVSEALCLPRRKTRSLSKIIHLKTQGFPLFVVEFLDALWTEKLLVHDPVDGWEWDVDAIDLKGISKSVAELLACKLKDLPPDVLSGVQVLSCFGSHVDFEVLEAVKNYDGGSGNHLIPALHIAQREGLVEKAGPTFTFSHDVIKQKAFDLIPAADRVPLLQKLVSCLIPSCMQEPGLDSFLFVTVDLINRIGSEAVFDDLAQSQLFARLSLQAGKKAMATNDFSSAAAHFGSGISFLKPNCWEDQYHLSLSLFESSALANYSAGNHEQVVVHANHVLSNAKGFEDKFKSYCVFINVIAIGSMEQAAKKLYDLLRPLGENIEPNMISPQMALAEFMSVRELLSGGQRDIFLHLPQMSDRNKLMAMKLIAMLVLYYSQQETYMSVHLVCKIIRTSLQFGHCEDTVYALSVFSATLVNRLNDLDEGYALGRTALSLLRFYNTDQLIPRVYGVIYGCVLITRDPLQSVLDPLLKACRLSFSNGNFEHSKFNTVMYMIRSWHAGKKIPLVMNEVNAFAHQHKQQSRSSISQLFLAPTYKLLSALSGITLESSEVLAQLASECDNEDIIEMARSKKEMLFVQVAIALGLFEAFFFRDFAKASQIILTHRDFFHMLQDQQVRINDFELVFIAGLVSFHMARETREPHWMEKGLNVLATFERWASINEWNFEHRFLLLKAELHHTKGETNAAVQAYDMSAEAAQKHRFPHQLALICELAAHYFGQYSKERTREMIQRSHDAYMEWGATRKAKAVINLLELNWLEQQR